MALECKRTTVCVCVANKIITLTYQLLVLTPSNLLHARLPPWPRMFTFLPFPLHHLRLRPLLRPLLTFSVQSSSITIIEVPGRRAGGSAGARRWLQQLHSRPGARLVGFGFFQQEFRRLRQHFSVLSVFLLLINKYTTRARVHDPKKKKKKKRKKPTVAVSLLLSAKYFL